MGDPWPAAVAEFVVDGPIGLLSTDRVGIVRFANAAAEAILERDVVGCSIVDLIHPDDLARIMAATRIKTWDAVKAGGRGSQWRMLLPDGGSIEILTQTGTVTVDGASYVQLGFLPAPPRLAVLKTLEDVAAARPLPTTFATLVVGIAGDETGMSINWVDPQGSVQLFGNLSPILGGVMSDGRRDDDPATPWAQAATTGAPARLESLDDIRDEVAEAARAAGYVACCVSPIPDPATGVPLLYVNWVRYPSHLAYVQQTFDDVLADVLQVALDRAEDARLLHHAAHHDQLTGLSNRRAFFEALTKALPDGPVSVLYLDLDGFKAVNDGLGHEAGDLVLMAVADRLRSQAPDHALVARLGGDEFAILVPGDDGAVAEDLANRIVQDLRQPFALDDYGEVTVGVSIGYSVNAPSSPTDPTALVRTADEALRAAKGDGKGTWVRR